MSSPCWRPPTCKALIPSAFADQSDDGHIRQLPRTVDHGWLPITSQAVMILSRTVGAAHHSWTKRRCAF